MQFLSGMKKNSVQLILFSTVHLCYLIVYMGMSTSIPINMESVVSIFESLNKCCYWGMS